MPAEFEVKKRELPKPLSIAPELLLTPTPKPPNSGRIEQALQTINRKDTTLSIGNIIRFFSANRYLNKHRSAVHTYLTSRTDTLLANINYHKLIYLADKGNAQAAQFLQEVITQKKLPRRIQNGEELGKDPFSISMGSAHNKLTHAIKQAKELGVLLDKPPEISQTATPTNLFDVFVKAQNLKKNHANDAPLTPTHRILCKTVGDLVDVEEHPVNQYLINVLARYVSPLRYNDGEAYILHLPRFLTQNPIMIPSTTNGQPYFYQNYKRQTSRVFVH